MRGLKFRAWDKNQKKMLDRVLAGPGDPCSVVWLEERGEWVHFDEFCGTIMQYTGMKDSKSNEVFEGDIIKTGQSKAGFEEPFIGRVYWFEGEYQWWITDDTKDPIYGIDYDLTFLNCYQDFEVIGNIYQNSELLVKKGLS